MCWTDIWKLSAKDFWKCWIPRLETDKRCRAVFAGGLGGWPPCEKWLTPCIVYKNSNEVDSNSPDDPSCPFEMVLCNIVIVNQNNTTLSGCDTPFPHMGGATLVWHGLWPSSLLGSKTLNPLLKFDKHSPEKMGKEMKQVTDRMS